MQNQIFSLNSPKAVKAIGYGWLNAIHYLAPADLSGTNLCPKSTASCRALCLGWFSGQASMVVDLEHGTNSVRASRVAKARRFMSDRPAYMRDVCLSIATAWRKACAERLRLCVRMNGSSDIAWEGVSFVVDEVLARQLATILRRCIVPGRYRNLMALFSDIQFVDYTKIAGRFSRALPPNYHLVLSRTEGNDSDVSRVVAAGGTAAVVFAGPLPEMWRGVAVIDGDKHDLRHLDPRGVIVGLSPKGGKAKRDVSGFVVREVLA